MCSHRRIRVEEVSGDLGFYVPGLSCNKKHNEINPGVSRQIDTEILSVGGEKEEIKDFLLPLSEVGLGTCG